MIDELASRCFATRDAAHREHWATSSYAAHKTLAKFYTAMPDALDTLIECYQGQYELVGMFAVELKEQSEDIIKRMRDDVDWMQSVRSEITNDDPTLLNLLDNIVAIYQQTIYRLTNLS